MSAVATVHRSPWILALVLGACQVSPPVREAQSTTGRAPTSDAGQSWKASGTPSGTATAAWDLPEGWNTLSAYRFESAVLAWFPDREVDEPIATLSGTSLAELEAALDLQDPSSVRAAVILARSRDPRAGEVLLARLEKRIEGPERSSDAGDVVAAAALGDPALLGGADVAARLERLAIGQEQHPDLEVRVECAASALARGRDGVQGFLLVVLRTHTPAAREELEDWEPRMTMAWAKGRAAEALSRRADVGLTFRADASYEVQAREALALERALRGPDLPGEGDERPGEPDGQ